MAGGGGGRKNVWQVGSVQSGTELCSVPATVQTDLLRVLEVFVVQMLIGFGFLHVEDGGSTFFRKPAQTSQRQRSLSFGLDCCFAVL
jgi:hypothetical protein